MAAVPIMSEAGPDLYPIVVTKEHAVAVTTAAAAAAAVSMIATTSSASAVVKNFQSQPDQVFYNKINLFTMHISMHKNSGRGQGYIERRLGIYSGSW